MLTAGELIKSAITSRQFSL